MQRCLHLYDYSFRNICRVPLSRLSLQKSITRTMATVNGTESAPASAPASVATPRLKYADVGINLGDPVFQGSYHGKQAHSDDLDNVVQRALDVGCTKMMVTGSDLKESRHAIELAKKYRICYATIGVHPCSATSFDKHAKGPENLIAELASIARQAREEGFVVAYGEFGLDYDRLHFASKETQLKYFDMQLDLAVKLQLPLFLHSRAAAADFERLLRPRLQHLPRRGLVHSFTGSLEEMQQLVDLGFDIGVNGCSLKTDGNLAVVKEIPLERLQLETDGPWCEIRPSHASSKYTREAAPLPKAVKKEKWAKGCMVKGRNEPCTIPHVAHVVAAVKGLSIEEVCEAAWNNSTKMFGLGVG